MSPVSGNRLLQLAIWDDRLTRTIPLQQLLGSPGQQAPNFLAFSRQLWIHHAVMPSRLMPQPGDNRIEHAWCERGEMVVDLAMPVGARIIKRERYYRVIKPEVSKVYSSEDVLVLSIKSGHYGPWNESEQLKK